MIREDECFITISFINMYRFTRDEIVEFVHEYFNRQTANPNTVDVVKEFQGYCTAKYLALSYESHSISLWNFVYKGEDCKTTLERKEKFGIWFEKLFSYGNFVEVNGEKNVYYSYYSLDFKTLT